MGRGGGGGRRGRSTVRCADRLVAASSASTLVRVWRSLSSFWVACWRVLRVVPCLRLASMWRLAPACSLSRAVSWRRSAASTPATRSCRAWLLPYTTCNEPVGIICIHLGGGGRGGGEGGMRCVTTDV